MRWNTPDTWLRRTQKLQAVPEKPALRISHDEDTEAYANGTLVATLRGHSLKWGMVPLEPAAAVALKKGDHLLALHCRQTTGGQYIDLELIDAAPGRKTRPKR